jgi:Fe-S cluster assembly protein SufD
VLIVTGEHSQVQIVESYAGANERPYFTNAVTEVVAGANAVIDHYKLQRESSKAFHLGSMYLTAQRGSTFSSHSLTLGGSLVRNDVLAALRGEGIDCTLNGLYLVGGAALVDNHTTIDHAMPHCGSHEVYKGILWGRARAVFNGKIIVRPDAQKTDAKQTNKALLLSDDAQINTKPELEIFANDVKCTHGAAIGQLDDDALFYLRSRGLGHAEARAMLIHAFAGDIINRVKVPALRAQLETALLTVLPQETA